MTSEIARKVIDSFHSAKTATHPEDRLTLARKKSCSSSPKAIPQGNRGEDGPFL